MTKKRLQISVGLTKGRLYRLLAIWSQHPILRHVDSLGGVAGICIDWAIAQLWKDIPVQTIQQILSDGLSAKDGYPWCGEADPLPIFAERALLSVDAVQAILNGRAPDDDEASCLAGALGRDIDEIIYIIRAQYYPEELAPTDAGLTHDEHVDHRPPSP